MEIERSRALFWPFRMSEHYKRFEQRVQTLNESALEKELSAPTYRHKLRDMLIRGAVGISIMYGISTLIQPTSQPTLLHWLYMFSLGPQALVVSLQSATRSILIQGEERILRETLASRRALAS